MQINEDYETGSLRAWNDESLSWHLDGGEADRLAAALEPYVQALRGQSHSPEQTVASTQASDATPESSIANFWSLVSHRLLNRS